MSYPRLMRVAQHFEAPTVDDIPGTVRDEVARLKLSSQVKPGQSIAISVGSRGIANIALIVKSLVDELKALGGKPFLVPAMGSHGGGIAENQRGIIESYGVTEEFTGAPIRASMETVEVGRTEEGVPVLFDRLAFEADHVAVVARVKPHTGFNGEIESGASQDDAHRVRQAQGRGPLSPSHHSLQLGSDGPFHRPNRHRKVWSSAGTGDCGKPVRSDGSDRGRGSRGFSRTRKGAAGAGQAMDAALAL